MRNDVFYHAQTAYRLEDCKRGKFIFVLADGTGIEREAQTIEAYLTRIAAEYADSLTNIFDTPVVRFVASGRYDVTARWEDGHITLQATSSGADYTRHGKMARNREVRVADCKSFVDALRKASNRSRLVCKAIGADMMTYARLLELFAKRPEGSSWFEFSPSADVWPNTADTQSEDVEPAAVETETVVVEPVEVEHDGVVDVELAETSETIPVVEAGTADAGTAEAGTAEADSLSNDDLIEVIANTRKVLADRETRAVESAPVLPAECDAVTQEIPEVPPQTNEDARVLQVSEHVIPACVTLKEYELTRNVPRKHCKQFRDARGRKCAYVVSADGGAFILWRDWYKHDDAELDAAVRAYYAQVA